MASPSFLEEHTGFPRINLPAYDIYDVGKNGPGETVYTRYRILGKESVHNTIQGILEIHLIEGYGVKNHVVPQSKKISADRPGRGGWFLNHR